MKRLLKIIDIPAALITGGLLVLWMVLRGAIGKRKRPRGKKLLVLDMAYTLEMIRERKLHESVTCRDLNAYFEHVWSVHPCATVIQPGEGSDLYGGVTETRFSERHTIAEGKIGRFGRLQSLPLLNFFLAQWNVYFYLMRLVEKEGICAVRSGDPYYLGLWTLAIGRANRIPCAVRVNVNYDSFYAATGNLAFPRLFRYRSVEKRIDRFTLRRMDLVAGANQDNLNFALANGARPEVASVFRYGNLIHSAHFRPPEERPTPQRELESLGIWGKPFGMTVSRLEKLKHTDDVLRIIAALKEKGYILYGLLVGEGRMRKDLLNLAGDLGIADRIIMPGNRDQEWLSVVLPYATVVMSPFMGRALTEAALGGAPIVAYDVDWQSELVRTGETGELVPYRDWQMMASAVEKFLNDPVHARRMGDGIRRTALEMMSPGKLMEHERNEYDKMIQRYHFPKVKLS